MSKEVLSNLSIKGSLTVPKSSGGEMDVGLEIEGKQDTITGGATTIASSNLTTSRALVSDGSGKVAVSAVTSTELGYLDGVTSGIQTQLNSKANDTNLTAHTGRTDNPHSVTKAQVGLGNVDNTADLAKPVSSAQQTALNLKADKTQVLTNVPANAIFTDTKYTHPANHPPSIISQDTNNRFVTDAEKTAWNGKETPANAQVKATTALNDAKSYVNGKVKTDVPVGAVFTDTPTDISGKVDKVTGKELSTNDYTTNEKNKLSGIDAEANKYVHPTSHPASIITQSSTARFVTDTEKSTWNGKVNQSQVLTNVPANAVFTDTPTDISGKVDKITGMGLSTNDYTSVEKAKLGGLHTVATSGKYTDLSSLPTLGTASSKNTGTGSGNIPILDSGGKLDALIIPALAISETFIVATQSAMLGLTAETGDICIRTDLSNSFILSQSPSSTLANWKELLTPVSPVQSVAGKVGVVTLVRSDVGLGNVDNTTDATKPVSSAQQTALNLKADKTQVLTNVPANAIFTDTKYTHPANHPPSIISQDTNNRFVTDAEKTAWNGKETPANAQVKATTALNDAKTYVDGKVLTDVPTGAIFTDTKYTHPATHPSSIISQTASARFVTDTEKGYWNAKVESSRVLTDVPANAIFTDTVYTHPSKHPASVITQDASNRFVTDTEKGYWNAKADTSALTGHMGNTSNPHSVTKAQVGLSNVNNTSDSAKPISTAMQTALNGKVNKTGDETIEGTKTFTNLIETKGRSIRVRDGETYDCYGDFEVVATALDNVQASIRLRHVVDGGTLRPEPMKFYANRFDVYSTVVMRSSPGSSDVVNTKYVLDEIQGAWADFRARVDSALPINSKIMKDGTGGTSPSGVLGGTWQDKSELMNNAPIKRIYYWLRTA